MTNSISESNSQPCWHKIEARQAEIKFFFVVGIISASALVLLYYYSTPQIFKWSAIAIGAADLFCFVLLYIGVKSDPPVSSPEEVTPKTVQKQETLQSDGQNLNQATVSTKKTNKANLAIGVRSKDDNDPKIQEASLAQYYKIKEAERARENAIRKVACDREKLLKYRNQQSLAGEGICFGKTFVMIAQNPLSPCFIQATHNMSKSIGFPYIEIGNYVLEHTVNNEVQAKVDAVAPHAKGNYGNAEYHLAGRLALSLFVSPDFSSTESIANYSLFKCIENALLGKLIFPDSILKKMGIKNGDIKLISIPLNQLQEELKKFEQNRNKFMLALYAKGEGSHAIGLCFNPPYYYDYNLDDRWTGEPEIKTFDSVDKMIDDLKSHIESMYGKDYYTRFTLQSYQSIA